MRERLYTHLCASLPQRLPHRQRLNSTSRTSMASSFISTTTRSKRWGNNSMRRCMTSKTSITIRSRTLTCLTSWINLRFSPSWINSLLSSNQEWWASRDKIDLKSNIRTTDLLKVETCCQDNLIHSLDKWILQWSLKYQAKCQDLCQI